MHEVRDHRLPGPAELERTAATGAPDRRAVAIMPPQNWEGALPPKYISSRIRDAQPIVARDSETPNGHRPH
jgi:hypothetical protein